MILKLKRGKGLRKSYTRGLRIRIIFIVCIAIFNMGMIGSTIDSYRNVETVYSEGTYSLKDGGVSVIKISGIEKMDIEDADLDEDEKFYLIEHEQGFIMLKATEEQVNKILGFSLTDYKFWLFNGDEVYARVTTTVDKSWDASLGMTTTNISSALKNSFEQAAKKSVLITLKEVDISTELGTTDSKVINKKMEETPFRANAYITSIGKWYYINNMVMLIIITMITFFSTRRIIKNIIEAKKNYEYLYSTHPEVERDFSILSNEAEYIDKVLKVIVYKESLILYKGGFNCINIADIGKLVVDIEYNEDSWVTKKYYLNILDKVEDDVLRIPVGKHFRNDKLTEETLKKLGELLKEKYNVKISYNY